jgi:hypothetical protein
MLTHYTIFSLDASSYSTFFWLGSFLFSGYILVSGYLSYLADGLAGDYFLFLASVGVDYRLS